MTSKQLVGTGLFVTATQFNLKIPVQESYLPVQSIKEPTNDLPKDMVYDNDARNLHFQIKLQCSNGKQSSEHQMEMGKQQLFRFFKQIEMIQDELNSYQ